LETGGGRNGVIASKPGRLGGGAKGGKGRRNYSIFKGFTVGRGVQTGDSLGPGDLDKKGDEE